MQVTHKLLLDLLVYCRHKIVHAFFVYAITVYRPCVMLDNAACAEGGPDGTIAGGRVGGRRVGLGHGFVTDTFDGIDVQEGRCCSCAPVSMRSVSLLSVLLLLLLGTGCTSEEPPAGDQGGAHFYPVPDTAFQATPAPDTLMVALDSVQTALFLQAFDTLADLRFTFITRTAQYDTEEQLLALRERRVHVRPSHSPRVLLAADSGRFEAGWLSRFVAPDTSLTPTAPTGRHIISDDPAYLSDRNRDAYRYVQQRDTLPGGHEVRVIDILARPGLGDEQAIRRARLVLEPGEQRLVGLYLVRHRQDVLFGETSHFFARLQPTDGRTWLPDTTRYRSRLLFPLLRPFLIEHATAYRDLE